MRYALLLMTLLTALPSCKKKPERPVFKSFSTPEFVEELEPTDNYLSVGTFLQKEFDKPSNDIKVVKVYFLMRQEASLTRNFATLKTSIPELPQAAQQAIDAADESGQSTVEFEVEVGKLKPSISKLSRAVSSMELSLGEFKE